MHYLLNLGAQEVYVAEGLGFELNAVSALCHSRGVKVRVYPNVAQSEVDFGSPLKRFFIRPEDRAFYDNFIDVYEFFGPLEKQDIIYKIYNQEYWFGNLKDIILGLDCSIINRTVLPVWAKTRATCGRRCLKGTNCSICERMLSISEKLNDKGYIITHKKDN